MVVEHCVHKRCAQQRVVARVALLARGGHPVPPALPAADDAPAATIVDVPELLHIDVEQVTRSGVFGSPVARSTAASTVVDDEPRKAQTGTRRQRRISVGHEDLPVG